MRKITLTTLATLVWLIASPSIQWPDSGWVEVGAAPAAAQEYKGIMTEPAVAPRQSSKKKTAKKHRPRRVGSSGVVTSNQPGKYPIRPITPAPQPDVTTGTVTIPERDPRYPQVPTVPVFGQETSQDRVARCTHQGALGALPPGQQGAYIHNCAF